MFQPVVPVGGLAGWGFLNRTMDAQKDAFTKSPQLARDQDYFRANIGSVKTAEDLVSDRRLLAFALSAFGLEADLPNKFFIQKVLSDGTTDAKALANRLSDKRYKEFAEAFGLGKDQVRGNLLSGFADKIVAKFETAQFEAAVGNVDGDLRVALYLRREVAEVAGSDMSERAKLFTVLGDPALRTGFEKALRLPDAFASLDIDRQVDILEEKLGKAFGEGTISQFSDPERSETLIQRFLLQSEVSRFAFVSSPAATALTLLRS
jgi:hypothetical protein